MSHETSPARWIGIALWARRRDFLLAVSCLVGSALLYLFIPGWASALVNNVLPSGDMGGLMRHMITGLAIFAAATLMTFGRIYLMTRLSFSLTSDVRLELYGRTLETETRRLAPFANGDLLSRLSNDLTLFQESLRGIIASFLPSVALALGFAGAMIWYSPALFLLVIVIISPLVLVTSYFGRVIHADARSAQAHVALLIGRFQEALNGAREIRAFGQALPMTRRFKAQNEAALSALLRVERIAGFHPIAVALASGLGIGLTVLASAWMIANGYVSLDVLIAFLVSAGLLYSPLQEASHSFGRLLQFSAVYERLAEIARLPDEPSGSKSLAPHEITGRISFRNLHFSHPSSGFALLDLNFTIEPRTCVAIVGPSGAGKSTLLDLVLGFLNPDHGEIHIDGQPLSSLDIASWRQAVGFVCQEPMLFEGSIRENLLLGAPDANEDAMLAAAKAAHVHEFVAQLPGGYDTRLETRGANLSVGQRQRIAIARALIRDPRVLLFDEPTSALDAESELLVRDAIRSAAVGRTVIMVAHRMTTIKDADRILVLSAGQIVEDGSLDALIAQDGHYARLHRSDETNRAAARS